MAAEPLVDCLIFSKDRAAQLDLLLRSVERYADRLYRSIAVLWTASDADYVAGYRLCRERFEHRLPLRWWQQDDFEADVWTWLREPAGPIVSFLVDDDVFYRPAPRPLELPWSYRGGDYDYPFSVDGNVYARQDVLTLLSGLHFRNPSELEHGGHLRRKRLPFTHVTPCVPPCLVGVPLNRVSESSGMPHMGESPAVLNGRYLDGHRLALPDVAGDLPAHAELPLVFA